MCTYDDQYVISAGADGNLFVYKFNSQLEPPPVPTTGAVGDQVRSLLWCIFVCLFVQSVCMCVHTQKHMCSRNIFITQVPSPPEDVKDIEDPKAYRLVRY